MPVDTLYHCKPLPPREIVAILERGGDELDRYLGEQIYANSDPSYLARQRARLIATIRYHAKRVGDRPTYLLRAPGRLNAFLEYLDMCAGDHMSTTIDGDIPLAVSLREDGVVSAVNCHHAFPDCEFRIQEELEKFSGAPWNDDTTGGLPDNWDNRTRVHPHYGHPCVNWLDYVICVFLRIGWELQQTNLRGADLTFGPGTIPMRAGVSSSSALVVLSYLVLALANADRIPDWDIRCICRLLGEAEWYVGTHGGANDHTTILRNLPNGVLYNRHSLPELDSTPLPCLRGVRVVLANSLWEANKALGAKHDFNLRKGWMDLGNYLLLQVIAAVQEYLRENYVLPPHWVSRLLLTKFQYSPGVPPRLLESDISFWDVIASRYNQFGSLDEQLLGIPEAAMEELIGLVPDEIATRAAASILRKDLTAMERDYTLPYSHEGGYRPRAAATFFYKENKIGRALERLFLEADARLRRGEIASDSAEYDSYRLQAGRLLEDLQDTIRDDFQVSNSQIDMLLDIAKSGPGYLGGKLTGAGSGGCVSILVREGCEDAFCDYLDREYYGKPVNFEKYREALDDLERISSPQSWEHDEAKEMKQNLDRALAEIPNQRCPVTFSRGACVLDLASL